MDLLSLFKNAEDVREYEPGEIIFAEGVQGDCMFVLLEGTVAVNVKGFDVWNLQPGELFGETALIDERPRSATAIARTAARAARVNERQFLFMVEQTPFFALHVMRLMVSRLRAMDETLS